MNMQDRPLWIDISEHQGIFDFTKMDTDNRVSGVVSRAGVGNHVDPQFVRNYSQSKKVDKYRTSYWAINPVLLIQPQIDKWIDIHPILDRIPRMLDAELNGTDPRDTGMDIKDVSDHILAYDSVRPWLYFGRYFAMDNVIPFVSHDWLNQHWIVLAQYDMGDGKEYESVIIPDGIDPERVIFKQTTDKMQLYAGGPVIDRDRFLLGGLPEMYTFMNSQLSTPPVEPPIEPPPVDGCEDVRDRLDSQAILIGKNTKGRTDNASEIEKITNTYALESYVDGVNNDLLTEIDKLNARLNELEEGLKKASHNIQQTDINVFGLKGQLQDETQARKDLDTAVYNNMNSLEDDINQRIDGLAGGHSHWWMGLFK